MTSKSLAAAIESENRRATAAGSLASGLSRWNDLHGRLVSPGIRSIVEMNKRFQRLTDPFGFRQLAINRVVEQRGMASDVANLVGADLIRATSLHSNLATAMQVYQEPEWTKMRRQLATIAGQPAHWREMTRTVEALGASATLAKQFERMSKFDRVLADVLAPHVHAAWSDHLKALAVPTTSLLAYKWSRPMGLLAELQTPNLGASVSWLTQYREKPLVMTAALITGCNQLDDVSAPAVIPEGDPLCVICDGPLTSFGTTIRWHGPMRGTKHRRLFPACSRCAERERDEPGFLLDAFTRLTRPRLYVVDGGGRGDGDPAGMLRLVPIEEDND